MSDTSLKAETRTALGSAESRRLRRSGGVPATVYGRDSSPQSVAVNARELYAALHTEAGLNAVITLDVEGDELTTLAREIQRHPLRGDITHVDFVRISLTETVGAEVGNLFAAGEVSGGIHGKNRLMGNSLLDYNVFGRRAGRAAARDILLAGARVGTGVTLDHAYRHGEACRRAGIEGDRRSPLLMPDYRGKEALSRRIDVL